MSSWTQRPSGLVVPAFSQAEPMSSLPAGWVQPKPERRIYTHRPPPMPADPPPGSWSLKDLHYHVKGRADSTAQLLIGVAILKSRGCISNYVVSRTGAVWQDWKGNGDESNRAHRIPCNPTITNKNVPDIAEGLSLRDALIDALAATDYLPRLANHADSRFEVLGAADSLVSAIRFVIREQQVKVPVDYDVFRHGLIGVALSGYKAAYEKVCDEFVDRLNAESPEKLFTRIAGFRANAPTHNLEGALEAASDLRSYTAGDSSSFIHPVAFKKEAERLNDLASNR